MLLAHERIRAGLCRRVTTEIEKEVDKLATTSYKWLFPKAVCVCVCVGGGGGMCVCVCVWGGGGSLVPNKSLNLQKK